MWSSNRNLTDMTYGQLLTEEEFLDKQDQWGADSFTAGIGAEAIREMLADDRPAGRLPTSCARS
jgi:hypothetical protein